MRWEGNRESRNVEDARGAGGGRGLRVGGGLGVGSIVIALVAGWVLGINPLQILGMMSGDGAPTAEQVQAPPPDDPMARFVSVVLADTEDVWRAKFQQRGAVYREPTLRIFRGATATACGQGQSAMGPFYCPADERVYIDLRFYELLRSRLGAPGDFAQAYVIAHEVAHHVQKVLGVHEHVAALRGRLTEVQNNALSVRVELQADCFAGIWAHDAQAARQVLEEGDIEEALQAASQIGDDAMQSRSRGTIVPESFTHGTSAQRVAWFKRGLRRGNLDDCDTFAASDV
jgi:predicted metalloprotease